MSGSLASGISALTMDDEYARQREKAKLKRVKGAKDGLYQGAATLGKGVIDGVTGTKIFLYLTFRNIYEAH
jgi:vacuolar protein sorting-associated protein 13A/C